MRFLPFLYILILLACNSAKKENPALKEAAQTQEQALQIEKQVVPQLEELEQIKNSISIQGRALTPKEQTLLQQIERIQASYAAWKEMPDYKYKTQNHSANPENLIVTQRAFRDSIVLIQQRVDATLQQAKKVNE